MAPPHEPSEPAAHTLLRLASAGRGCLTDSLILVAWSAITFWNAWFLGRSLLARSPQFRRCSALGPSDAGGTDASVAVGLVLRFVCLFIFDVAMYTRFAWPPSQVQGWDELEGQAGTGPRSTSPPDTETEAKLRALVAELRRENDDLRLKAFF